MISFQILDRLQMMLWSVVYLLIIGYSLRDRTHCERRMPLIAGSTNLAWELNALLLSGGGTGHLIWFVPDCIIYWINIRMLPGKRMKAGYAVLTMLIGLLFAILFRQEGGMLISCFVIDFTMELEFVLTAPRLARTGRLPIAVCKLLGDLAAWFAYMQISVFAAVIGLVVFLLNSFYVCWCLEEQQRFRKKDAKRRK